MKKLHFKVQVNAPVEKVYRHMLGLDKKSTYESWTSVFHPTSTYEGSWEKGSKIYFVGIGEDGKKGGMISEIAANRPAKFVSIRHYGMLNGEEEITTGEQVEKWAGSHENYSFEEEGGITRVTVEMEVDGDHAADFTNSWPKALGKLKKNIENSGS
jgi:hypothetical protein